MSKSFITLQVAAVSLDVGVAPVEDKHAGIVLPEVQAVAVPHLQALLVQILSIVPEPHAVAVPHKQTPLLHVSELPLHVKPRHGSERNIYQYTLI